MMKSFQVTGVNIIAGLGVGVCNTFPTALIDKSANTGVDENSPTFRGYAKNGKFTPEISGVEVETLPIKKVWLMRPQPSNIKH